MEQITGKRWTTRLMLAAALGVGIASLSLSRPAMAEPEQKAPAPEQKQPAPVKAPPGMRQLSPEEVEKLKMGQHDAHAPQPAAPGTNLPKALELSETSFDWGNIADTEPVTHSLKVKNTTDKTIKIAVAASCGCTVGKLEKDVLAPNEEVSVGATFNPQGRNGPQTKTLTITVTEPQGVYAQQTVTLTSNVKALVTVEPPKVFLSEVDHREGKKDKVVVVGRKEGFDVVGVESNSEFLKATIGNKETVEENGEKLTKITIDLDVGKGAPIGAMNGQLTIKTNDEKGKPVTMFVGADVQGDVRATPPSTMIRAAAAGAEVSGQIKMDTRSGKPFRITGIELEARSDLKLVTDYSSGENGNGYIVTISGVAPDQPGLMQGTVVISTDSLGGETIRVPFTLTVPRTPTKAPAAGTNGTPAIRPAVAPAAPGAKKIEPMSPKK
ncbi:MAG TPA: DUF1573 domain-containing protein [Phycisphaerales bacterium]|nr:DUF1573 domain-containing protein [Phycisphaerales bacterium]